MDIYLRHALQGVLQIHDKVQRQMRKTNNGQESSLVKFIESQVNGLKAEVLREGFTGFKLASMRIIDTLVMHEKVENNVKRFLCLSAANEEIRKQKGAARRAARTHGMLPVA
jgi:hypothetical protein